MKSAKTTSADDAREWLFTDAGHRWQDTDLHRRNDFSRVRDQLVYGSEAFLPFFQFKDPDVLHQLADGTDIGCCGWCENWHWDEMISMWQGNLKTFGVEWDPDITL